MVNPRFLIFEHCLQSFKKINDAFLVVDFKLIKDQEVKPDC